VSLAGEVWGILTAGQRRRVLAAQLASLLMALFTVVGISSIAPFFAVLGNPHLIDSHPLLHWLYATAGFQRPRELEIALGVAFIALVLLADAINAAGLLLLSRIALGIGNELQTTLFTEYLSRPYLFHTATNGATLVNNVVYEVGRLNNGVLQNGFILITQLITGCLIVLTVTVLDPTAAAAMLLALAGGYLLIFAGLRGRLLRLGKAHGEAWSERGRLAGESFSLIKEILLLEDRRLFLEGFAKASEEASRTAAHIQLAAQLPKYIMECLGVAALVGAALLLGGQPGGMGAALGPLTFAAFATYRLLPILQQVFASAVKLRAERPGFERIAPDLRRARAGEVVPRIQAAAGTIAWWCNRPREQIQLADVSFRYADGRHFTLSRIGVSIPARSMIAIAGPNGSGKSTLLDLIAGLLTPTAGDVRVDGVALDATNIGPWQKGVAYVPQNVALLDTTIEQNIAFGEPPGRIDRARLDEAARTAQLEQLLGRLPQGYAHRVGERGVSLSGGERQRIGIARALYRRASLLLLDEATSALDGLTEAELMLTLARLRGSCTIILISHRPGMLRECDMVLELQSGRLQGVNWNVPEPHRART
jgi:ATP-binding cassette, subfamily B, bacterial PglK